MQVKLIQIGTNYAIRPANTNDTTIIMVGVASKASCIKTCKKRGYTIVK